MLTPPLAPNQSKKKIAATHPVSYKQQPMDKNLIYQRQINLHISHFHSPTVTYFWFKLLERKQNIFSSWMNSVVVTNFLLKARAFPLLLATFVTFPLWVAILCSYILVLGLGEFILAPILCNPLHIYMHTNIHHNFTLQITILFHK